MAKQLKEFKFRTYVKYPWDQWLNGEPWKLTQGEDFPVPMLHFRTGAAAAAVRRGLRIHAAVTSKTEIVIQAVPR